MFQRVCILLYVYCLLVYASLCVFSSIYFPVCIWVYMFISLLPSFFSLCVYVCVFIYASFYDHIFSYASLCVFVHLCLWLYIYIYIHIYKYICINIYIYIYRYIYIHIYIHRFHCISMYPSVCVSILYTVVSIYLFCMYVFFLHV